MSANLRLYDESREGTNPPAPVLSFAPIADPELSWRACGILWALCHWAWGRRPDCWPSNAQVARLAKCSSRTVQLGLAELVERGYLERWMEKTPTGWRRVLRMTERAPGIRLATVAPPAGSCATPMQDLAPPPAQDPSHQTFESSRREKKELAAAVETQGRVTPPPGDGPEWLQVDNLTAEQLDHWRQRATEAGPFGKIARRILERFERNTKAPGSPAKDPRGPSLEGTGPSDGNAIKDVRGSQDRTMKSNIRPIRGDRMKD